MPTRPRLAVEALEDRTTPTITTTFSAGVLTVSLSGDDNVTVGGLTATGTDIDVVSSSFPQQNFSSVTSIVVNDTSGGGATNQRVGFDTLGGTSRIAISGSVTVTGIETIALNSPSLPMSASDFTFSGARVVNTINTLPQLSASNNIIITATGTGDAIGTAANPIRLSAFRLATNTTAGNGNQYFDLGGAGNFTNVNGGSAGQVNAGTGTVTLTNGQFFGAGANDFGNSTTFNLGTGSALSALNTETVGGLTGTGIVGAGNAGTSAIAVGGGNVSSTFGGTIQNVAPSNSGAGVLNLQKTGTGTFTLTGANTYTGTTTINAGTLQIGAGGTAGTLGTGAVTNNATLTFNRSDNLFVGNTISGTGSLVKQGTGATVLTANNTYSGTTTINVGQLDVGTGGTAGTLGTGAVVNNGTLNLFRSDTITIANAISGTGLLAHTGSGTVILTGANTSTGNTQINVGAILRVGNGGTTGSLGTGLVFNGGTVVFNRSDTLTVSASIIQGTLVRQEGTGTTILTGANTYTGTTTITAGTLQVGNGGTAGTLGTGAVTNNATLTFNRSDNLSVGNTISGTGSLAHTGTGTVILTGANTYSGTTTITAGGLQVGNGGTAGTLGTGAVTNNGTLIFARSDATTVANAISGTGGVAQLGAGVVILTGANTYTGNTQIDAGTTLRVGNGGTTGSLGTGLVFNGGTVVFNRSDTLTVSASIIQGTLVRQEGTGTTILTGANTYTGTTTITAGTLQVGNGGTAGTLGTGAVTNNATLTFNRSDAIAIPNTISGTGSVAQSGAGTTTLAGANTYTGTTTINAGKLLINGTVADGAANPDVVAAIQSAVGGAGTIQGSVQIQAGAAILPGDPTNVASLSTGSITIQPTGVFGVKINAAASGQFDALNVTGTVTITGANLFIPTGAVALPAGISIVIVQNDGTDAVTGTFANDQGGVIVGQNGVPYAVSYTGGTGNDVTLTRVSPPPAAVPLPPALLVTGPGNGGGQVFAPTNGQYTSGSPITLIPGFTGEIRVSLADVNGDGILDTIAGTGPGGSRVRVLDGSNGAALADFIAFPGFAGGVFVAGGDLTGDRRADVVVTGDAPDAFSGPQANGLQVRVFDGASMTNGTGNPTVTADFNGLASLNGASGEGANVRLGGRPAIGDVNGDGRGDLLIAAGGGGGPRICIWDGTGFAGAGGGKPTTNPLVNVFVFESSQRGGAFVTAGDITGDGKAEIVAGGGPGGGPRVRVVDSAKLLSLANLEGVNLDDPANLANGLVLNNFFAGDLSHRGGVRLTVRDVDGDGKADVVTGSGTGEPSAIRVYKATAMAAAFGSNGEPANQVLDPFGVVLPGGVWVG